MNIDVEAFGLYLAVIVAGALLLWSVWPAVWPRKKVEEVKLDPIPEPAPAPVVEEVKPAPVASLEPVVAKAQEEVKTNIDAKTEEIFVKVMEEAAKTNTPISETIKEVTATVEPVKVAAPKAKKPAAKKEKTFVPAAAPKPKAPAKKAPAKKVTKK
jgi:hypothetical protein